MHKNMQKLYESMGSYLAFDPHAFSIEDFFGDLANFRNLFMVSTFAPLTVLSKHERFFSELKHKVSVLHLYVSMQCV